MTPSEEAAIAASASNNDQLSREIELLEEIAENTGGSGGEQTISSYLKTDDGTITAGATYISFVTSSDFVGTINTIARVASTTYIFQASIGKTLPAIPYVTTAGSINIDKIS